MISQMHTWIPRPNLFEMLPRLSAGLFFERTGSVRTSFRVIVFIACVSVSLSSALAEIEEATGQDAVVPDDILTAPPWESIRLLSVNNYGAFTGDDAIDSHVDKFSQTKNLNSLSDLFAPDAVWSLDVSTGAHLDHESSGFGSELDMAPPDDRKINGWWTKESVGFWTGMSADIASDELLSSAQQLQVASCGGNVEHRDLDYCSVDKVDAKKYPGNSGETQSGDSSDGVAASKTSSETATSSNASSTSMQQNEPNTVQDLSPLIPASVNDFIPEGELTDIGAPAGQCDDVSSCSIIGAWRLHYWGNFAGLINWPGASIDSPTVPTDSPIAPVDSSSTPPDLPPSNPVVPVDDPVPVSDPLPIFTPPPPASSVPETSTWIMFMLGFGFLAFAHKRSAFSSVKRAVVRTCVKIIKQLFHHYAL